ncbi:unnamed protein product, partial [Coregonus sp. 'balchen']
MEATSLTFNNDFIDVYGRGGKGSIFVWASGNGGLVNDHCGADGYVNSVYSIAIGAVTHTGKPAFF